MACNLAGKGYEEELNRLLEKEGYVELDVSKVIITGAAGSGKTCTKLLLYKLDPPKVRQSTKVIEPMDRAYAVKHDVIYQISDGDLINNSNEPDDDDDCEWIVVKSDDREDSDELIGMLAATIDSNEWKEGRQDKLESDNHNQLKKHPPTSNKVLKPASESHPRLFESASVRESSLKEIPAMKKETFERQESETRKSLLSKLRSSDHKGKCVHRVKWIHLVDSGGQSRFHDILPAFLHQTSVIIFVLKVSKPLDEQLFEDYYEDGECVGDSSSQKAPYKVEQILQGVIQAAMYEKHRKGNETQKTKILIVGTHIDEEKDLEKSIHTKDSRLKLIFDPFIKSEFNQLDILSYEDYDTGGILFPLDAMKRDLKTMKTGKRIRKNATKGSSIEKVPISWFLLEEDIRKSCTKEKKHNHGIVTIETCRQLAQNLGVVNVEQALNYFHDLNIFLYFESPDSHSSISKIVFTDTQIVVEIVSYFVKQAHQKVTDTQFRHFSTRGEFTESLVTSKLSRFFVPGFQEKEIIELLKITLVIAPIKEGKYFMPCVLSHCPLNDFEKERFELDTSPVVIKLPGDSLCACVPRGFFCALICSLMQKWELRIEGELTKIYKNFVQFTVNGCRVTVADTFFYVEIHVHGKAEWDICRKVDRDVCDAIEEIVKVHNYDEAIMSSYSLDFVCPCNSKDMPVHPASISGTGQLTCTRNHNTQSPLKKEHSLWLSDQRCYLQMKKQGRTYNILTLQEYFPLGL